MPLCGEGLSDLRPITRTDAALHYMLMQLSALVGRASDCVLAHMHFLLSKYCALQYIVAMQH